MEPTMRSANTMPLWLPALMAGLLLAASSCSRPPSFDEERGSAPVVLDTLSPQAVDQAATELAKSVLEGVRAYKLQPGDVIDVLFLADHRTAVSDYKIGIGDELELV